jgi:hypothetical protein
MSDINIYVNDGAGKHPDNRRLSTMSTTTGGFFPTMPTFNANSNVRVWVRPTGTGMVWLQMINPNNLVTEYGSAAGAPPPGVAVTASGVESFTIPAGDLGLHGDYALLLTQTPDESANTVICATEFTI